MNRIHFPMFLTLLMFLTLPLPVVAQVVDIPDPNLRAEIECALGKAAGATITADDMATLTEFYGGDANISNVTGLEYATNLTVLELLSNRITDISALSGLTNLTYLGLGYNNISDISSLVGLTQLEWLWLHDNRITDISAVAGLTNLTYLSLSNNPISDWSLLCQLLAENPDIDLDVDPDCGVIFDLSLSAGTNLIHVPLKVTAVDGEAKTIDTIGALYDALGGANAVNYLITYDASTQAWLSYFGSSDRNMPADQTLNDAMGILVGMKTAATVRLDGDALGTGGSSGIALNPGINLVGLPLRDPTINRVSDLLSLNGIQGNVSVIILADGGDFKAVGQVGDPGDIAITGGQGFILTAQRAAAVTINGEAWTNVTDPAAAPTVVTGIKMTDTTPVLGVSGSIIDEGTGVNRAGFRVIVKNLSTDRVYAAAIADDEAGYRLTVVDIETMQAARVGDLLEITAQAQSPFIGVKPLRHTVTTEDVLQSLIRLPELVAYEIPKETELLANYPNPFNPETWIPYRLAEDGFVTLTIYDQTGRVVRSLDVGHRVAAVYESRSKAIYWDGRNGLGEVVASGVYFYHLRAGDYSATRRMLILK